MDKEHLNNKHSTPIYKKSLIYRETQSPALPGFPIGSLHSQLTHFCNSNSISLPRRTIQLTPTSQESRKGKALMPIQLPTKNPSKICTLNYACGHCRYFKIEEITSELTAPHHQNSAAEGVAVSSPCSDLSSPLSSPTSSHSNSDLPSPRTASAKEEGKGTTPTTNKNDLALLRVVDRSVLCPSCASAASYERFEVLPSESSDDGSSDGSCELRDEDGLEAGGKSLERLISADGSPEEVLPGWWDLLDLDELLETDGEDEGNLSDDWEVVEPCQFL